MRAMLLTAAVTAAHVAAFANSNAGSKFFISKTPVPADINATAFATLEWEEVKGVGNLGETGNNTNILSYDTWDGSVVDKAKGMTNAGDPELEVARIPTDAGQTALRAAAATNLKYGFKIEKNDKPDTNVNSKPTTIYNRGLVTGPRRPNGRNEDFDLEVFGLAMVMKEIVVDPISGGS